MTSFPRYSQKVLAPLLWCLLSAVMFGAATPVSKPLLDALGPLRLSGALYLGAALGVLPWVLRAQRRSERGTSKRDRWRLAGAVLFGGILGPALLLSGLSLAPAASVSLWLNLETVATAVLARWFFAEHMSAPAWIAVALIVLASVLLAPGIPAGGAAIALVALACIAWGLDNNFTSVIDGLSPAQVTLAKGLVAGTVNLGLGLWMEPSHAHLGTYGAALAIGAVSYGGSLLHYIAGAQQLGAVRSQLAFSSAPLWGVALSALLLGEAIGAQHGLSVALMVLAIWLLSREQHDHAHIHEPVTHRHFHRHDDGHHSHPHDTEIDPGTWHSHVHTHHPTRHAHPHLPDLHHRHDH